MEDFIEGFGITQNKLAVSIGVPPGRINDTIRFDVEALVTYDVRLAGAAWGDRAASPCPRGPSAGGGSPRRRYPRRADCPACVGRGRMGFALQRERPLPRACRPGARLASRSWLKGISVAQQELVCVVNGDRRMVSKRLRQMRSRLARKHWAVIAAAAGLVAGGCAMYLSWGAWGVFVACSALTLVGSTAPALMLLPRSAVTGTLIMQVASCAVWFMLIGWGLVLLLYPEYTIGWRFPGRGGRGMHVKDEADAVWIGWSVLGMGIICAVVIIAVEILPRIRAPRVALVNG
ncbi:hypothetical protein ACQCX5_07510 [Propionibacteriaceae bacterium G57]|uniref:hypothetical protein n=1 Tax=Aestuariimicrobium sp. G57 TaxID=3418485 RepID=UPI003DA74920